MTDNPQPTVIVNCPTDKAEEKLFSFEKTLIDLLGFIKKLAFTIFDSLCRPWRLIIATHLIIQNNRHYTEPGEETPVNQKYTAPFLYFVMCLLYFLYYYKSLLFNAVNQLWQSNEEVIANVNNNIADTTINAIIILYIPVISITYLFITISSYFIGKPLAAYLGGIEKKKAEFFFRRTVYYVAGSLLFVLVLPVYIRNSIPSKSFEVWLTYGILFFYLLYMFFILCFPIADRAKEKPGEFSIKYVKKVFANFIKLKGWQVSLLVVIFTFVTCEWLVKWFFRFELKELGHLHYTPSIKAEPLNKEGIWYFTAMPAKDSNFVTLTTEIVFTNRWDRGIVIKPDSLLVLNKDGAKLSFHIDTSDGTNTKVPLELNAGDSKYMKISAAALPKIVYQQLIKGTGLQNDEPNANYELNYYPINSYEKLRRNKIKCIIKPY